MMRPSVMRGPLALALLASLCGALPPHVCAEDAAANAPTRATAQVSEALVAFEAGVDATRASRWTEAREAFRRSLALAPKASTHFNLAVVCVKLGLGAEAITALDAFDALARGQGYDGMRAKEPQLRAEAEALLPPTTQPAIAEVAPEPAPPKAARPRAEPSRVNAYAEPTPEPRSTAQPARRTLVAGGVLGGVTLGLGVWAVTRGHAYRRCLNGPGDTECYERSTIAHERNGARATAISFGVVSAVVITVGAVKLGNARTMQVGFTPAPRAFGASLSGTY